VKYNYFCQCPKKKSYWRKAHRQAHLYWITFREPVRSNTMSPAGSKQIERTLCHEQLLVFSKTLKSVYSNLFLFHFFFIFDLVLIQVLYNFYFSYLCFGTMHTHVNTYFYSHTSQRLSTWIFIWWCCCCCCCCWIMIRPRQMDRNGLLDNGWLDHHLHYSRYTSHLVFR